MLWNIVYDFFVQYIFGGYASNGGQHSGFIGNFSNPNWDYFDVDTLTMYVSLNGAYSGDIDYAGSLYVPLGNYLSLIATIISMVVIVFLCCMLIKKIYNIFAHIIG